MSSDTKSSKARKISHETYVYIRQRRQDVLATELRNNEKHKNFQHNDPTMVKRGREYYESGFSLEEIDESLKQNNSFMNGYNWASHIAQCALDSYDLGFLYFLSGENLENAINIYINNEHFRNGYFDAKAQMMIDGINLDDIFTLFGDINTNQQNSNTIKKIRK